MNGLLSILLVSSLALSPVSEAENVKNEAVSEQPCRYEVVADNETASCENLDTYAEKADKTVDNSGIKTLEEPIENEELIQREKKPFAKIIVKVSERKAKGNAASTSAMDGEWERVIAQLDAKFEHMYEIKNELDKIERESARLWSEYYALKEVYDRALRSLSENWAEDNGVAFVPHSWRR